MPQKTPTIRRKHPRQRSKAGNGLPPREYADIRPKIPEMPEDTRPISTVDSYLYKSRIVPYNPDDLVAKKGLQIYGQMAKDEQVKAALKTRQYAVLASGYKIDPPRVPEEEREIAEETAEFVRFNFEEMEGAFDSKLLELMTADVYGFSLAEEIWGLIDYGKFDGKIGLKDLSFRKPFGIDFDVDDYGALAEDGIIQAGRRFPARRFLLYTNHMEFSNRYGESDLRPAYRCYSEDTEILTENGWKSIGDITKRDFIATLNSATDQLEYHVPNRLYRYPYRGKMFHQSGRFVDFLVTPNHRIWAAPVKEGSRFRFVEAQNLRQRYRLKRDAKWIGEEREFFILPAVYYGQTVHTVNGPSYHTRQLPERRIPMDDWLQFFGLWLAEGHVWRRKNASRQCVVGITQNAGDTLEKIKDCATKCGFTYYDHKDRKSKKSTIEVSSLQLYEYMKEFGSSHDRYIPRDFKTLSRRQLLILYEAMMLGDGSHRQSGNDHYATVSKRLADDVSEIILKIGFAPTIVKDTSSTRYGHNPIYLVAKNSRKISRTLCNEHKDRREWLDYDGHVYCLGVPNHLVYVRRNGKSCWSGNSWWSKDVLLRFMNIALERYAEPTWVFTHSGRIGAAQKAQLDNFIKNLQSKTGIVLPDFIKSEMRTLQRGAADPYIPALKLYDTYIRLAILMPGLMGMSGEEDVGSLARSRTEFDVFMLITERRRKGIETAVNEQAVKRLMDMNYEVTGGMYPTFSFDPITEARRQDIFTRWSQAVVSGALTKTREDENRAREMIDFQPLPEDVEITDKNAPQAPPLPDSTDLPLFQKRDGHKKFQERALSKYERRVDFAALRSVYDKDALRIDLAVRGLLKGARDRAAAQAESLLASNFRPSDVPSFRIDVGRDVATTLADYLAATWRKARDAAFKELPATVRRRAEPVRRFQVNTGFEPVEALEFFNTRGLYVKGLIDDALTAQAKNLLFRHLRGGRTTVETIGDLRELFEPYVGDPTKIAPSGPGKPAAGKILEAFRLENIIRTETTTALNEGRLAMGDAAGDYVIGYEYSAIIDCRETLVCHTADGLIIRKDDPRMKKLDPPNHHNCRSVLVFVTEIDAPVEWSSDSEINAAVELIQEGFD